MSTILDAGIHIDSELQAWIAPLSADEYAQLEAGIIDDGCRDPLVIWSHYLLDGHNRYEICTRHNIGFKTVEKSGLKTKNDARIWMIQNQLARRNVTDYARAALALKLKPLIAERSASRMRAGKADPVQISVQGTGRTRDEIAKAAGVSHDTVRKVELIEESAAPEVKSAVHTGAISIHAAAQIATLPRDTQAQIAAGGIADIKQAAAEIRTAKPKVYERTSELESLREQLAESRQAAAFLAEELAAYRAIESGEHLEEIKRLQEENRILKSQRNDYTGQTLQLKKQLRLLQRQTGGFHV